MSALNHAAEDVRALLRRQQRLRMEREEQERRLEAMRAEEEALTASIEASMEPEYDRPKATNRRIQAVLHPASTSLWGQLKSRLVPHLWKSSDSLPNGETLQPPPPPSISLTVDSTPGEVDSTGLTHGRLDLTSGIAIEGPAPPATDTLTSASSVMSSPPETPNLPVDLRAPRQPSDAGRPQPSGTTEVESSNEIDQRQDTWIASSQGVISLFCHSATRKIVNPNIKYEASRKMQLCGDPKATPVQAKEAACRFLKACHPSWPEIYAGTQTFLADCDDKKFIEAIERFKAATKEDDLYEPLVYLVNTLLEHAAVTFLPDRDLPHLKGTYNTNLTGTSQATRPDLTIVRADADGDGDGEEDGVDDRTSVRVMRNPIGKVATFAELKYDKTQRNLVSALKLTGPDVPIKSTYSQPLLKSPPVLTGTHQALGYLTQLMSYDTTQPSSCLAPLISNKVVQILYVDSAGGKCTHRVEYAEDFAFVLAALVAVASYGSDLSGAEDSPVRVLSSPEGTPLLPGHFDTSPRIVHVGNVTRNASSTQPFHTQVEDADEPGRILDVYGYGINYMENPKPIKAAIAERLAQEAVERDRSQEEALDHPKIVRPRKSTARRLAYDAERLKVLLEKGTLEAPKQFAPVHVFGKLSRYEAFVRRSLLEEAERCMVQLSLQHQGSISEPALLRRLNLLHLKGIPTLIGSYDVFNYDEGRSRAALFDAFHDSCPLVRRVNSVLRVMVVQEACVPLYTVTHIGHLLGAIESIIQTVDDLSHIGVLHGNISPATMMASTSDFSRGMLVGFDQAIVQKGSQLLRTVPYASVVDPNGPHVSLMDRIVASEAPAPHAPFLALDCCTDTPPARTLAHELESVVFSLFWMIAVYRRGRSIENDEVVLKWWTNGWESIRAAKEHFVFRGVGPAARSFAEALGVDAPPLQTCCKRLASSLLNETLQASTMIAALREARLAYEA